MSPPVLSQEDLDRIANEQRARDRRERAIVWSWISFAVAIQIAFAIYWLWKRCVQ